MGEQQSFLSQGITLIKYININQTFLKLPSVTSLGNYKNSQIWKVILICEKFWKIIAIS